MTVSIILSLLRQPSFPGLWQPYYKPCADDIAIFIAPILGRNPALMRFDDLARDGQAQARMAAETLGLRPLGVETVEDGVEFAVGDAWPFIVHGQFDHTAGF